MADRKALRLAASLMLIGWVLITLITQYVHPHGGATEAVTFAINAASGDWMVVHLGQFASLTTLLAGLLVLSVALNVSGGSARWLGLFGAVAAGVGIALAGVLYALDGVANKQAELAWVNAPADAKLARFASAQVLRWLEWGVSGYLDIVVGLALVLVALVIVQTARVPRPIGYLLGLSGLTFPVQGWIIGTTGFTPATTLPTDVGYILLLAALIWLLVVAWRMNVPIQEPDQATPIQTIHGRTA